MKRSSFFAMSWVLFVLMMIPLSVRAQSLSYLHFVQVECPDTLEVGESVVMKITQETPSTTITECSKEVESCPRPMVCMYSSPSLLSDRKIYPPVTRLWSWEEKDGWVEGKLWPSDEKTVFIPVNDLGTIILQ